MIPAHTQRVVEHLLRGYCERICPPTARHAVLTDYAIEAEGVTLRELRRIHGVAAMRQPHPLAQFRYLSARNCWQLFVADGDRWRRYVPKPEAASFIELLRELDRDAHGIFFTRIEGKSLRWCSSQGRCAGCEQRYAKVLGVQPSTALRSASISPLYQL